MIDRAPYSGGPLVVGNRRTWSFGLALAVPLLFAAGIAIRLWLWPQRGFAPDIDVFVLWVHGIATDGLGNAYDQNLSFPALMAWIWGALAAVEPAFRTVTDASDPAIAALMKVPASIADLGLAGGVAWWFRDRPKVAVIATGMVLLWPVTWYISAWWGQYEAVYVLPALLALLAARAGRPLLVGILLAASLMTKPQALPFVIPFAAWLLATQGWRGTVRAAIAGGVTVLALWAPFIGAGGPANYLRWVGEYQTDVFGVLSLRAWNPWWVVQELGAGGNFVLDSTAVLGPLTFRHIGFLFAGLLGLLVFAGVYRAPSAQRLALGLGAITLVAFVALTTMHERYAYPAFIFLLLGLPGRAAFGAWAGFAVVFALNLATAVPAPGVVVPEARMVGLVGAAVMTVLALGTVAGTVLAPEGDWNGPKRLVDRRRWGY